jgi:hypothetical protein
VNKIALALIALTFAARAGSAEPPARSSSIAA